MKKNLLLPTLTTFLSSLALCLILSVSTGFTSKNPTPDETGQGIQFFEGTWQEALAKAKKENKLIFLDANASWCRPCKLMEKRTFTDVNVGAFYNKNFINVKMDMEKGEGIELSKKLGITAYPTLFFIDGNGTVSKKNIGYLDAEDFLTLGQNAKAKK